VHVPPGTTTKPVAVVFVFHGHGGSMLQASKSMRSTSAGRKLWCFLQVCRPGQLTDRSRKTRWLAARPGDQGDRDLKFFHTVCAPQGRLRMTKNACTRWAFQRWILHLSALARRNEPFAAFGLRVRWLASLRPVAAASRDPRRGENDPLVNSRGKSG